MPAERIMMRDDREIIRLKFSSVSTQKIAAGMARSTVRETLKRPRGYLPGYLPVTVSQIHCRERAFKPVHSSSRIPRDPISRILMNWRELP